MFEKFVSEKIEKENDIVRAFPEISRDNIIRSSLSDFTKNFLLADSASISDEEQIRISISKSNKLYFNYTIRPKWTLVTFLFNNFESRPPDDLIKKLEFFPFYKFYIESIREFINEDSPIFVTKQELSSIIDITNKAIHEKLTKDFSNVKIKNFFLQIFLYKYENESAYNLESSVPYSFIRIFLEDKSFFSLEEKFKVINNLNDETEVSLKDVIKVLTDKLILPEKEVIKPAQPEILDIKLPDSVPGKETITKSEPKYVKKEPVYSEELVKAAEKKSVETSLKEKIPERKSELINALFSKKQSEKISVKIYNSDLIKREKSFEKLGSYETWKEAAAHLKEIFLNNNVDIYNKEVVSFVNILNDYFNKKR